MSSPFDVEVRLTSELTTDDRQRLCTLFEEVFHRPFPDDLFLRKYRDAWRGESFHCLALQDGIAGAFSAVLFRYSFFGRECVFATAIDLMLESRFRPNVPLMKRISDALYSRLAEAGVSFVFSCVREEMMRFHKVVGKWHEIGRLTYYIAPVRGLPVPGAGAVLRTVVRGINAIARPPVLETERELPVQKLNDDQFRNYRYSFFATEYRTIQVEEGAAVYTGRMFWPIPGAPDCLRLGMLVDVWPAERVVFDSIVREIVRTDPTVDYLIYVGHLPFQPRQMWRVPGKLERPRYYLGGRILRPDLVDERVYDIDNWSINLSNTDLV